MISIDSVRFDFIAPEEKFVRHMYANWDDFCHSCFEQVVEECCMPYDEEGTLFQLDKIDIDLGMIEEEKLYEEYPNRLRQELKRILMSELNGVKATDKVRSASRISNIIHRLKYGSYNMKEVQNHRQDDKVINTHHKSLMNSEVQEIASLVISDGNALRRLLIHIEDRTLLLRVFGTSIAMQEFTVWQKNQFLMTFLELKGDIPVRFIHESDGRNDLYMLAELLDSRSVRRIMHIEMERHSKAGMPVYWHYLYEWLLQYYPYNDASLFGGKSQFVRHLHQRFLTFIYSHTYLSYLSEYELTLEFLTEVFGRDQYLRVAEAINRLLRRNVGNVAYETCLGREMYMAFLRLSMLRNTSQEDNQEFDSTPVSGAMSCDFGNPDNLIAFLSDRTVDNSEKTTLIRRIVKEQTYLLVEWLQMSFPGKDVLLSYLVDVADEDFLNRILASISLSLLDEIVNIKRTTINRKNDIEWLKDISNMKFEVAWNKAALISIACDETDSEQVTTNIIRLLHQEVSGIENQNEHELIGLEDIVKPVVIDNFVADNQLPTIDYVNELKNVILSSDISEQEKRRKVALLWDKVNDSYAETICLLHDADILSEVLAMTAEAGIKEILRMLSLQSLDKYTFNAITLVVCWLYDNCSDRSVLLSYLIPISNDRIVNGILGATSLSLLVSVEKIKRAVIHNKEKVNWLKDVSDFSIDSAWNRSVLIFIAIGDTDKLDNLEKILYIFHNDIKNASDTNISEADDLISIINDSIDNPIFIKNDSDLIDEYIERIKDIVMDSNIPDSIKQKEADEFWKRFDDSYAETIHVLYKENLFAPVFALTDKLIINDIMCQLSEQSYDHKSLKAVLITGQWLYENVTDFNVLDSYISPLANDDYVNSILGSVSLSLMVSVKELKKLVIANKENIEWLSALSDSEFEEAWNKSVLLWLVGREYDSFNTVAIINMLYKEVKRSVNDAEIGRLVQKINESTVDYNKAEEEYVYSDIEMIMTQIILSDDYSEQVKRMEVARFWDTCNGAFAVSIYRLKEKGTLGQILELTSKISIKEIVRQLSMHSYDKNSLNAIMTVSEWLNSNVTDSAIVTSCLVPVINESYTSNLLHSISDSLYATVIDLRKYLLLHKDELNWMKSMTMVEFDEVWNKSVLLWIASGKSDIGNNIRLLLLDLCNEIRGHADESEVDYLINEIYHSANTMESEEKQTDYYIRLLKKALILHDRDKYNERTAVSLFWDHYSDSIPEAISILHNEAILTTVINHTNSIALNEIYRKLAKLAYSGEALSVVLLISEWMEMHKEYVRSYNNSSLNDVSVQMILWLQFHDKPASGTSPREIAHEFLDFIVGESNTERVYNEIMECCVKDVDNAAKELLLTEELKGNRESILSYLNDRTSISTDILAEANLKEHQRSILLEYFMNTSPKDLLEYIRKSIRQDILPVSIWCKWLVAKDWRRLAYTISVSIADLLVKIIEVLDIDNKKECVVWARYLSEHSDEDLKYNTPEDNVKGFLTTYARLYRIDNNEIDNLIQSVKESLGIEKEDNTLMEDFDGRYQIPNAGLCLLAPWFVRLFDMLGYLDFERSAFKDTSSKIRAVFLLQYLVYGEERQYKESDLLFNRLLTDIPVTIPLPKSLSLSEKEKETADGMIAGVKANWQKMDGTSINGFRKSFISRNGVMSRPNDHWVITVEEKAYDIMLDTVPWGFRQIRLPWLKTFIQVVWQDKHLI